jgi:hypothetical protein
MMISLSYFSDRNITNRQQSHTVPKLSTVSPTRGKKREGAMARARWRGRVARVGGAGRRGGGARGGGEGRLGEGFEGLAAAG